MKRGLLVFVGLLYLVSWFLPTARMTFIDAPSTIYGWQGFLLCVICAFPDTRAGLPIAVLAPLSALSNAVIIPALFKGIFGKQGISRPLHNTVRVAAVFNCWFMINPVNDRYLTIGYFAWLATFVVLGLAPRRNSVTQSATV